VIDKKKDGVIDLDEWKAKVFDDFRNPLQMLREVVFNNEINGAELLRQMRIKVHDDPLDLVHF